MAPLGTWLEPAVAELREASLRRVVTANLEPQHEIATAQQERPELRGRAAPSAPSPEVPLVRLALPARRVLQVAPARLAAFPPPPREAIRIQPESRSTQQSV